MSDNETSAEDRNLPASEKRLQDARDEGRVPRSKELASLLILGVGLATLIGFGPGVFREVVDLVEQGLRLDHSALVTPALMGQRLMHLSGLAALAVLPTLVALSLAGIAGPLALSGWNFTWKPLMPDFARINPLDGIRRLLDRHAAAEMAKSIFIVVALAVVAGITLYKGREQFAQLAAMPLVSAAGEVGNLLASAVLALVLVIAVAAAIDVPLQLWRHHSRLRMTIEEMKRESRESDGDPQLKARIRAQQRELARRRMMDAVPGADVVVTNPTHYAVALAYKEGRMRAPTVVAKGADLVALRIRELATKHAVPVLEQPALARALHRHAEVGEEVPVALYSAVAQVLAYVYQLKKWLPGMVLRDPGMIAVPPGLDPDEERL